MPILPVLGGAGLPVTRFHLFTRIIHTYLHVLLRFLSDRERTMLETLDYSIRIGSTLTFLYFDFYVFTCEFQASSGKIGTRSIPCNLH